MSKQLILAYFVFITLDAYPQHSTANPDIVKSAEAYAIAAYHDYTGKQSRLYNGIQEYGYLNTIEGHAFYLVDIFQQGSVVYDGILYDPVQILYDNYKDQLVILTYSKLRLTLLSEKVREFDLQGHHFVRHEYDSLAKSSLPTGFYDHLYDGKMTVLVKRAKALIEKVTDKVEQKFQKEDRYFIFRNDTYYPFNSYRSFLNRFPDKSKDIRNYLKSIHIKYKTDPEKAILKAVKYYETLH